MLDLLFVMNPLADLDPKSDSTIALMQSAQRRGHRVERALPRDVRLRGPDAFVAGRAVASFDAVFLRADPPVDLDYLTTTMLLDRAREDCLMVNDPWGLRNANEKLYALNFADFTPDSVVTSSIAELREFLTANGGEMVVKPLERCGGSGVLHVRGDDRNTPSLLEMVTDDGRRPVIAQRYLPGARRGDKRILLLDGEPLGAILRVPADDETRANLHVGARAEATVLTLREQALCAVVGERCRRDGLVFAGVDVIDGHLTEVNVTSPTGLRELAALGGGDPAGAVVDWVEARLGHRELAAA